MSVILFKGKIEAGVEERDRLVALGLDFSDASYEHGCWDGVVADEDSMRSLQKFWNNPFRWDFSESFIVCD